MSREYESGRPLQSLESNSTLTERYPYLAPTEAAFLGNPVRTSAAVRDEQIRRAVTEALAPLTRDLGLIVEALAARFPLPVRTYNPGWVVLWTDPDTRERSLDTSTLFATEDEAAAYAAKDPQTLTVHRLGGAA